MSPETLEALHGSIAKWQAIVDGTGRDDARHNCPLCKLFYKDDVDDDDEYLDCGKCPVYEKTGERYCKTTPYDLYVSIPIKAHAQAELDFLKSLLPKDGD